MTDETRPEWVTCVTRTSTHMWCGKRCFGFSFINMDHAIRNAVNEGRLTVCPDCLRALIDLLGNQ